MSNIHHPTTERIRPMRSFIKVSVSAALFVLLAPHAHAQKFLGLKGNKKMVVKRLLPPAVNLTKKRIGVSSEGQGGVSPEIAAVLKTRVVTAIQRDPNFIVDEANPETRLSFKITTFRVESATVQEAGANPPRQCTVYIGRADVSYQAIEVKTGIPQDSENLSWSIDWKNPAHSAQDRVTKAVRGGIPSILKRAQTNCGTQGKSSQSEAADELYAQLVQQVTQRAAPVDEPIEVWLPGGKVKELSAIALEKRWAVLQEKAEQMPKLDKSEDDAGRVYLIALAHEALAYDSRREAFELERRRVSGVAGDNSRDAEDKEVKFFNSAKGHLEKAAQFYREAIAINNKEIELKVPEGRIEYAVRLYATIERQRNEYIAASRKKGGASRTATPATLLAKGAVSPEGPKQAPHPQPDPGGSNHDSSNQEVMKLCQEKLDEPTILDFIKTLQAPQFDLSVNGLIAVRKSCGDSTGKYLAAMRARMGTRSKPPARPKPTATISK